MTLNGPTLPPVRGPATHLVVLVHGYGADGQDLLGLAPHWQSLLPTAAFAAPNAPMRIPGGPGYQWFPISRIDPHEMRKGVEAAGPALDAYLDGELARLGLPPERLALVGFSGLLAGAPPAGEMPPILLTHGDSDTVIPPQAMFLAAAQLGLAGARIQWHLAPGMGHGIDPEGMAMAGQFLNLAFSGLLKSDGPAHCVLKPS